MFPTSEHPYSEHRNIIGVQRSATMTTVAQRIAELRLLGYESEASQMLDELSERMSEWGNDVSGD